AWIFAAATLSRSPITLGTVAVFDWVVVVCAEVDVVGEGPDETTSVTVEPLGALAPAAGVVEMSLPAGTVSDGWVCWVVWKPAWPRALAASVAFWPTTLGTRTWPVPEETVRVTVDPRSTLVPGDGLWSRTSFWGWSLARAAVLTVNCWLSRSLRAVWTSLPRSSGTATWGGPVLT